MRSDDGVRMGDHFQFPLRQNRVPEATEAKQESQEQEQDDGSEEVSSSSNEDGNEDDESESSEEELKPEATLDENLSRDADIRLSRPGTDQSMRASSPREAETEPSATAVQEREGGLQECAKPSRKRPRPSASDTGPHLDLSGRPLKRAARKVSRRYAVLLAEAQQEVEAEDRAALPQSQVGLTVWSSEEKDLFFRALDRLGRDDLVGIARRVGTKGELEVRQYLWLLGQEQAAAAADGLGKSKSRRLLRKLRPSEVPAALEIGEECGAALEQAADGLALLEEQKEDAEGMRKHGDQWLVTEWNCEDMTTAAAQEATTTPTGHSSSSSSSTPSFSSTSSSLPSPLVLFNTASMLRLSKRVFMNAASKEGNWAAVGELPSIRMEALEDLQELVYAVAQRLTAAALYFGTTRVRSQFGETEEEAGDIGGETASREKRTVRQTVRRRDVAAAVASLGLQQNSAAFWARSARRLNLRVYREEEAIPRAKRRRKKSKKRRRKKVEEEGENWEEEQPEAMTYDEVEKELLPPEAEEGLQLWPVFDLGEEEEEEEEVRGEDGDGGGDDGEGGSEDESGGNYENGDNDEDDEDDENESNSDSMDNAIRERVEAEVDEALHFSAMRYTRARWPAPGLRRSLRIRIAAEVKTEDYADAVDAQQSRAEEARLWAMLEQQPSPGLPGLPGLSGVARIKQPPSAAELERMAPSDARRYPLEELLEAGKSGGVGGGWREKLAYQSEWEATAESAERALEAEVTRKEQQNH